jgi:hypothetical protein
MFDCGLSDDIRLGQIGIDSLGLILIVLTCSTQTGPAAMAEEGSALLQKLVTGQRPQLKESLWRSRNWKTSGTMAG